MKQWKQQKNLTKTRFAENTILRQYSHVAFLLFLGLNKYLCLIVRMRLYQLCGSNKTASSVERVPNYGNTLGIN